ncbi:hypothetical protein EJ05DRAFT_512275 [Pseudovirgaria hyperparasitica]|uniref:Uncharacterized protein n=1 Tax=Pseudovirgaria hyperparasitica TaxID=470096 RepID=A0A6A6W3V0_9PEZI|nr:uncharacterized protein EJ05DRAFT_512275 [Pseudovirgaria hyperparasitica]KAF2756646.1 hypothetical protein EJ05DRAFT_512275 [Pseudovirgaria hyperparasitica]
MKFTTVTAIFAIALPMAADIKKNFVLHLRSLDFPNLRSPWFPTLRIFRLAKLRSLSLPDVNSNLVSVITSVAPESKTCSPSQYGQPEFANECATAADAAPQIEKSFKTYQIDNSYEKAAIIALMLFESEKFKFNKKHFPTLVPGQGTRSMQDVNNNRAYAEAVLTTDDAKNQLKNAGTDVVKVLELVNTPELSFGSGAWYLAAKCSDDVRKELQTGTNAGWEGYMKAVLKKDATPDAIKARRPLWEKTKAFVGKGL